MFLLTVAFYKRSENFDCFLFLFDEGERILITNITSSTKQLDWFSANQRRTLGARITELKPGVAAPNILHHLRMKVRERSTNVGERRTSVE